MKHAAGFRRFLTLDDLSRADLELLLASARALKRAPAGRPLTGKHVAVLGEATLGASAAALTAAATALGAKVTHVRTGETLTEGADLQAMARMLGRLYDAVACEVNEPQTLTVLERDSGVPVFGGVAQAAHPLRLLADLMAMQDAVGSADAPLLCLPGQSSPTRAAWKQLATLAALRLCTRPDPPPHDDAVHAKGFFFFTAGTHCDDGGLALRTGKADGQTLAAQQMSNHRLLVQSLLLQAIG